MGKCVIAANVLCIWGVVQLSLMAFVYYTQSPLLIEDVGILEDVTITDLQEHADEAYFSTSRNCVIAATMYLLIFLGFMIRFCVRRNKHPYRQGTKKIDVTQQLEELRLFNQTNARNIYSNT